MKNSQVLVAGFPEHEAPARQLAAIKGFNYATVSIHRFPDGESRVRLPQSLPPEVIFYRSLDNPGSKLIELMLAAKTARELGAGHLTLVAPYLCYMRQDIAFHPGEAVSQRIVCTWLASLFERIITVDPHLHRIDTLQQVCPGAEAIALSATRLLAGYLIEAKDDYLVLGPDAESRQWVAEIARHSGYPFGVASKQRKGDKEVSITLPELDYQDKTVVLADDVVSTGHTLARAARLVQQRGARKIICTVTHPLFCDDAVELLHQSGISQILSTDSIRHSTNLIALAALLAEHI